MTAHPQAPSLNGIVLKTPLPGPKTAALIARDRAVISPSYTRGYPLAIARGQGAWVEDPDGNVFLDFCAGIAVCSTGHSHPKVVAAITQQAQQFIHMSGTDFYYAGMADLAERLVKNTPGSPDKKVFFANSGAEANEGALKLARYATGRQNIISFFRSFHGRTFGAMSVTASKSLQRKGFSPLLPGVFHTYYPYHYRAPFGPDPAVTGKKCLEFIEEFLFKFTCRPDEVAAFIVEPIQGEGGYIVPPDGFLQGLQALARQHGILIIADEVQAGMGRSGKLWASQHFDGFEPDIMTSAKGIASGLPLGAIIARSDVMTWEPGTHATTFGGNPVACASALATLDVLEHDGALANSAEQGAYMLSKLAEFQQQSPVVGDVRGRGLMIGIELVTDKASKGKAVELRNHVVDRCFEKGLLVLGCGECSIRLSPPLIVSREQCDIALGILTATITECVAG